ncbi:histidine utilization repressor [Aureimonas psammosilenae]|uniref:histidine utilization repressor n=1 Tax=Aureimonas psammosilenae TaxID=2495496 RepID=UPI001260B02D|nr:histidine utilization repressor [Aureimonas psammosilenae]
MSSIKGQKDEEAPATDKDVPLPLYARLKRHILDRVETGEWLPNHRVPSENELVESLGVSRMTANRALRELAAEGVVTRIRGKGSFVAQKKRSSQFRSVPNIADEIGARGGQHAASVILMQSEVCGPELADALDLAVGAPAVHSIIVHKENDLPIQIEDRFVNPAVAPGYMSQDFGAATPNGYLSGVAPIEKAEQFIEAVGAQPWECRLLAIARTEPCLLVRRRTWSRDGVVSAVRLLYPGSRYRLEGSS